MIACKDFLLKITLSDRSNKKTKAISLMMYAPEHGGIRSVPRPEDLPISSRGPLRLNQKQMQELEQVRQDVSRMKILQFLRRNNNKNTESLDDHTLMQFVMNFEEKGRSLGIQSERALGYWSWLMLGSNSAFAAQPFTQEYLLGYPEDGSPDDKLYKLMSTLASTSV